MIQTAAPSVASATLPVSGQPAGQAGKSPESGHFARVLADHDDQGPGAPRAAEQRRDAPEPARTAAETQTDADASADPAAAPLTGLAAPLPAGGKLLPVAASELTIPVEVTSADPLPTTDAQPAPTQIPTLLAVVGAIQVASADAKVAGTTPATNAVDAEDGSADGETASATQSDPAAPAPGVLANLAISAAVAPVATPVQNAMPVASASASDPALAQTGPAAQPITAQAASAEAQTAQAPLTPAIAAQMAGLPIPAAPTQAQADPALSLPVDPAHTNNAPMPAFSLEPAPARPMSALRLRPVLATEAESRRSPDLAPTGLDLFGQPAGPLANAMPLGAQPGAAPVTRPHDFAGLVDRLIAARDAAQTGLPQTVHMSVNHADFGPISLNFQHDQAGLSVSVASSDPDFTRAVQAAIPAAGAATAEGFGRDSRQGSGQQAAASLARFDGTPSGQSGHSGQRHPGSSSGFGTDTPAANRSGRHDEATARPRGIFA